MLINKIKSLFTEYRVYFKSTFLYLFSSLFTAAIGIGINPFLALKLSPEDYAIIGYFNSFNFIVLPILNFSLITYFLKNYFKIPDDRKQAVTDTLLVSLLVYGLFALIIICSIFYFYLHWNKVSFPFYPYAFLAFTPIYLVNFQTLFLVNCRMNREAVKYSKVTVFNAIITALFSVWFVVVLENGATGKLAAPLLASLVTAVYCFTKLIGKVQFDFTVIKDAFRFGWPLSLSAILWYFLSGVDIALLEILNDSYTLGFYTVGIQITGYLTIFYTAISQTFEPDLYKAIAEKESRKTTKIIASVILLNAFPNLIFIIFAPYIISILTFGKYTEASEFAQILALKNITVSFYFMMVTLIVGLGFTKEELLIRIFGALASFFMFKSLINLYGFYGAAWGQVLSFIVLTIIAGLFLGFKHRIKKVKQVKVQFMPQIEKL